jgi:protein-disulfide isomerase
MPGLRSKYQSDLAIVFRHWPLAHHRFAYPAARAAECAAAQGAFASFHDAVFKNQDRLGLKTFTALAAESGVADLNAFDRCSADSLPVLAIDEDVAAAKAIGGTGTPTIVVNGWLLTGGGDRDRIDSLVQSALRAGSKTDR